MNAQSIPQYNRQYAHLFLCFLLQRILRYRLESLLNVDGLLGRGLKVRDVPLGLTPRHCPLLRHL